MTILALDLAKHKSTFCLLNTITGKVSFGTLATQRRALQNVLE